MKSPSQNPYQSTSTDGQEASDQRPPHDSGRWWSRVLPHERQCVFWATTWFFFILLGYFILRPVRETMGIRGGTRQLQGLFLASFVVMLAAVPAYSALVARLPRRWLVRVVYHFFAACLILFWFILQFESEPLQLWTARVLFVWVSVFSLFATSVFWSVLADLFNSEQGKRFFGMIAAGGTAGAISGSLLTSAIASRVSIGTLLLIPVVIIELGLCCAWRLEHHSSALDSGDVSDAGESQLGRSGKARDTATGGNIFAGVTHVLRSPYLASICAFLFLVQLCGTHMYFMQAEVVNASIQGQQARTQLFANLDLGTQMLTLLVQFALTGVILRRLGVGIALATLPVFYFFGFAALAANPSLGVLVAVVIIGRAIGYGVTVPTREVLFTVVSREDKYKSKSFIDTVVLRGGDAIASQLFGTLRGLGHSLTAMNVWAVPVTVVWVFVSWHLGRRQQKLAAKSQGDGHLLS